jgi:HlyD family secretion protein
MIVGIIIILLLGGGYYYSNMNGGGESKQKFRKVKVERGEISQVVTATGTINPVITVLVGSQVSGTIKALYADFNSRVKEGQVIAQIDPAIFEAQVQQGKASVQNAQAGLQNAEANLQNARAGFLNAQAGLETSRANVVKAEVAVLDTKRTLDRNLELTNRKVIAQAALDTAQANYDSAVAQKDATRAQMEQARRSGVGPGPVETAKPRSSLRRQIEQAGQPEGFGDELEIYHHSLSVNGTVIQGMLMSVRLCQSQAPTLFTIAKT